MSGGLIPIDSTAISHMGYSNGVLTVKWKSNKITAYVGVPHHVWKQLEGAQSKGSFVATKIKGVYREL